MRTAPTKNLKYSLVFCGAIQVTQEKYDRAWTIRRYIDIRKVYEKQKQTYVAWEEVCVFVKLASSKYFS